MIDKRRQPTLADRFVAKRYTARERFMSQAMLDDMQRRVRAAHKFVLDDSATTRIAHVVRDIPELLIREYDFARAPFDLTWVEFPHDLFWRECGNNPADQDLINGDLTVGYLMNGNVVSVVMGGTIGKPNSGPYPGVLHFHLNTEWPADYVSELAESSGFDGLLWGSSLKHFDTATRHRMRLRNVVTASIKPSEDREFFEQAVRGHVGELRNIVAIMLMLNRPTITRYSNVPPGKGFVKGKLTSYAAHTTVTIDIDAVATMKLVGTPDGEAVPRRWHEVRGFYRQDRVARSNLRIGACIHDYAPTRGPTEGWEPWPDAPPGVPGTPGCARNWVCAACGGKRWFVVEHERGHRGIGVVTHDYQVTAS